MWISLLDTKTLCGQRISCVFIFLSMSPYLTAIFRHFCACASCPDGKSDAERGILRTHCTPSGALARNVFDHSPFPSKDFSSYCRPCSSLMISPAFIIVFLARGCGSTIICIVIANQIINFLCYCQIPLHWVRVCERKERVIHVCRSVI